MPAHAQTSTAAIVAAGRHLLEQRGVDALTMQGVAEAVGVRAPSLYKRVHGRCDLFRLILDDVADEPVRARVLPDAGGDALERVLRDGTEPIWRRRRTLIRRLLHR